MFHKHQIDKLGELCVTEHNIRCNQRGCKINESLYDIPLSYASEIWFHRGWRVNKNDKISCPKCNKV